MSRMLDIMERNESKLTAHDLLVPRADEISMTELSAVYGLSNVNTLTSMLRDTDVFIKKRFTVTYGGVSYLRYRNTPRSKWRPYFVIKAQDSGVNVVTVPYAKPDGVAPVYAHLRSNGHNLAPLPSLDEQREIIRIIRAQNALGSSDFD